MALPVNLNYSQIKPIGYPSNIKMQTFYPTSFASAGTNDTIKFNITTPGFWDPYSAYIKLEVDVTGMDKLTDPSVVPLNRGGAQQLDHSASSFINALIITNKGTEIERISEYDTLAAMLHDMNYTPDQRLAHRYEGFGSNGNSSSKQISFSSPLQKIEAGNLYTNITQGIGFKPWAIQQQFRTGTEQGTIAYEPAGNNIHNTSNYTGNRMRYEAQLFNGHSDNTIEKITSQGSTAYWSNIPGTSGENTLYYGYQNPYCGPLQIGTMEPQFSDTITQMTTLKGQLSSSVLPQKQTFCIPLLSGLLGVLMPQESYKYIPMMALEDLILEFRLNPHALFTSGYKDIIRNFVAGDTLDTFGQMKRFWKITKFELNVEMQYFEPDVEKVILNQLESDNGIVLHTQSWMLGPEYSLAANQGPHGNYSVNLGFESLKVVLMCVLADDYINYSFCRKQYRLSGNISSLQIKIGNEYFPQQPITGNSGTCGAYQADDQDKGNNSEFLINLQKAFGKLNDVQTESSVNTVNFAVNERCYDPTDKNVQISGNLSISSTLNSIANSNGNPFFHENRCVGKAIFGMNLETLNQDFDVISGINTINNRPFEINIKQGTNGVAFTRQSTLSVFCLYDMIIQLKKSGLQVLGRG